MAQTTIPLYYWKGHNNFGDELSPYLVEKITGLHCSYQEPSFSSRTLFTIGSILQLKTLGNNIIWGTGTLLPSIFKPHIHCFPLSRLPQQIKAYLSYNKTIQNSRLDIRAVRGPKTKLLLESLGFTCPSIYGDPAILLPLYYTPKPLPSIFDVGLILHHSQTINIPKSVLLDNGILPISIERTGSVEIEQFINQICSCKKIFSSSLHGIITAQSYDIPAQWIQIKGQPIQKNDHHKYEDYFLGSEQAVQAPLMTELTLFSLKKLLEIHPLAVRPFKGRKMLLNAFPFDFVENLSSTK